MIITVLDEHQRRSTQGFIPKPLNLGNKSEGGFRKPKENRISFGVEHEASLEKFKQHQVRPK